MIYLTLTIVLQEHHSKCFHGKEIKHIQFQFFFTDSTEITYNCHQDLKIKYTIDANVKCVSLHYIIFPIDLANC